jgi:hypothetical protein
MKAINEKKESKKETDGDNSSDTTQKSSLK